MAKVRTRKRGKTYSYIFEAGRIDGKRKVVEKGGYETAQAAYDAGIEAYTDWQHGGIGVTSEKITLGDFAKKWLEKVCKPNIKETSFAEYSMVIGRLTSPLIEKRLTDITPAMIDGFLRKLAESGLAYATLRHQLTIMREMLNYAVYPAELITSNPAIYVKAPKTKRRKVVERKIISRDELDKLIAKNPNYRIPLMLMYCTGMRIGEACGLSWENVNLQAGTISITQQEQRLGRRAPYLTTPKTPSSIRTIPIGGELLKSLAAWKTRQAAYELENGGTYVVIYADDENTLHGQSKAIQAPSGWRKINLVCTRPNGKPILKSSLGAWLKLRGYNAHSFRHTHATILIEAGANPKGVAARLGHASTGITEDLYTHTTEKMQADTERLFERVMQTK